MSISHIALIVNMVHVHSKETSSKALRVTHFINENLLDGVLFSSLIYKNGLGLKFDKNESLIYIGF